MLLDGSVVVRPLRLIDRSRSGRRPRAHRPAHRSKLSQPRPHVAGHRLHQTGEIGAQLVETGQFFERLLVHVQRAIDLDLQAVPVRVRAPLEAYYLDPLVSFVDPDIVVETAKKPG